MLGVLRRADLLDAFKAWVREPDQAAAFGSDLLRGCKASDLKALADVAMRARGCPLRAEVDIAGEKMRVVYKQCELTP